MGGLIGTYKIPYATASEAIGVATTVVSKYSGKISRASLATEFHMSDKGGAYTNKLATFKQYGLLQGRDMLQATDLAQKIALSKDATIVAQSKANAFLGYPLFSELFGRMKTKILDDDAFTNILAEVTGVNRIEASKKRPEIQKYYTDALQYLKAFDFEGGGPTQQTQILGEASNQMSGKSVSQLSSLSPPDQSGLEELRMEGVNIWIRPDSEHISVAKGLLDVLAKRLKSEGKQKSSHVNG